MTVRIEYRRRRCIRSSSLDDAEFQSAMAVSMTVASPSAARCRGRRDHTFQFVSQSLSMPPGILDDAALWHVMGQMD
jgi:hypothetical protein